MLDHGLPLTLGYSTRNDLRFHPLHKLTLKAVDAPNLEEEATETSSFDFRAPGEKLRCILSRFTR